MKFGFTLSIFLVLLLLTACAQSSSTRSSSAPQPQSKESPKSAGQESAEAAQSGQQESQQTSQSSGQSSAEISESERRESERTPESAGEKSAETAQSEKQQASSETESGQAAASESEVAQPQASPPPPSPVSDTQEIESASGAEQTSAEPSADAKLAEARDNLRISQETERRIAGELEALKASGSASEEAVKDYESYLKSVEAMTAENRKIVEKMEAAYARNASTGEMANQPSARGGDANPEFEIPEENTVDQVAALDRQLDSSLAKFDGMLLQEMDEIRAGSSNRLRDLAEEAADAARRLREQGYETGAGSSQRSGENQSAERTASQTGSEGKRTGNETAARDESRKGGEGSSGRDQRRASYEDDDIVARQLREAAEKETDPELKKKLWKEYEEYKKSQ